MSKKLVIIGAGVDKGIGMPLANELVPEIRKFLTDDEIGKEFDKKIRNLLPNLRFSYDSFIKKAVEKLATDFKKEVENIKSDLTSEIDTNSSLTEEQKNKGKLIKKLLEKVQKLQDNVKLDTETEELIKNVFPNMSIEDENIINLGKLTFSRLFEAIMESFFEESIQKPNDPIFKHIYKNFMDLENLLLTHFIGFYNQKESDIKKYLYISWTLWGYLVYKEKQLSSEQSLYKYLDKDSFDIISFNYTSFSKKINQNTIYFHGQLPQFINLKVRQLCDIDNYDNLDILHFTENTITENLNFANKNFVIPALIPPIKLKPVLSNKYISIWHEAQEKIKNAEKIIIIGYSFNYADEHFNDIIRKNKDKEITIIDPNNEIIKNLQSIFSHREDDYVKNTFQGKNTYEKDKLKIIQSKAEEIDIEKL